MRFVRGSGILAHPTSLPGPYGSGDLGGALDFLRWLAKAGQRYWQILPLGPCGYGDSPYSAVSAFAANPLMIDLGDLVRRGWLSAEALANAPASNAHRIDFPATAAFRQRALRTAAESFFARPPDQAFDAFCKAQASWLDDYAMFMALHERHEGRDWSTWPKDRPADLAPSLRFHRFTQWVFRQQWNAVRREASAAGIQIVGDIPIFVAHQSAEVWAHPELFFLDDMGKPTVVAGVPPDYFSETGQRWGNPLYRWDVLAQRGYDWWISRFKAVFETVDVVRVDHFRGFAGYWEIPAAEETAVKGRWAPGPGVPFFDAIKRAFDNKLPIIAEDLGVITPDVSALRDQFGLAGMKVLQFAFGSGPKNPFLPHNHVPNSVVYTGTHDNDTTLGWFPKAGDAEKDYARRYLGTGATEVNWDLMRVASASVSDIAIFPLQDVLGLGSEGRMNTPGLAAGNWAWRFTWDQLPTGATERLRNLAQIYGRLEQPEPTTT
jgi:4-alpha-glucanotransferase